MNGCDAMNIGMVMALIKNALTETVTTINSIEVMGNDLIFKTASDTFTITIPEPTLGVDKIEIENKNLKITYNDSSVEKLDLSFLKGDKGDLGVIGDNLITKSNENPSFLYGGTWELEGISGSAYLIEDNLLIDFEENGRINYNYTLSTTNNYMTLTFPFEFQQIPFATGTGIFNSMSVNIIGIKTINTKTITINIPLSGQGCLAVQGIYKEIGANGTGKLNIDKLIELGANIKYHWCKVG